MKAVDAMGAYDAMGAEDAMGAGDAEDRAAGAAGEALSTEAPSADVAQDRGALRVPPGTPYALLHRPGSGHGGEVELLAGPVRALSRLDDLDARDGASRLHETDGEFTGCERQRLVLLPYRQIAERGYACPDDGEPLLVMDVARRTSVGLDEAVGMLPQEVPALDADGFDVDDATYAATAERIVREEIGRGEGANFVLSRSFRGTFRDFTDEGARAVFRRLLLGETGAYWTFLVHTGDRYFIGSTPEQHVRVSGSTVSMNPISGTYRYPENPAGQDGLLSFLRDAKEADELYMVVDEELKMMAAMCDSGIRVSGPALKRMSRLAHTEYFLEGVSERPLTEILRQTMFAPTVTGSPLENACRVIERHEPGGRGYYSGVIALIGDGGGDRPADGAEDGAEEAGGAEDRADEAGGGCGNERAGFAGSRVLDSAILIRTAEIGAEGTLRLAAGSTIVRESVPASEAAETSAKVSGVLASITRGAGDAAGPRVETPPVSEAVHGALRARNVGVSSFWLHGTTPATAPASGGGVSGQPVVIVDGEDAFTSMLAYQLRALGCRVSIVPWQRADELTVPGAVTPDDLVLFGPGPGNPRDRRSAKMVRLRRVAESLLARTDQPVAAVCLGHQVVCAVLGLRLDVLPRPNQGRRALVGLRDGFHSVGFYNSYTAYAGQDTITVPHPRRWAAVSRTPEDEVTGLHGPRLSTIQFHAESFLTEDGPDILRDLVEEAVAPAAARPRTARRHPALHKEEAAHGRP